MDEHKYLKQFEIMRDIAMSASQGLAAAETAHTALEKTSEMIGLSAGSLILWDDNYEPILAVSYTRNETEKSILQNLERDLFVVLRKERQLVSAYMTFGGDKPLSSFTLPIRKGDEILGAVIGIQPGRGSLVNEDLFLEALAAALSTAIALARFNLLAEKEKLEAVIATAATVNHNINNALQAIIGTIQLLTKRKSDLDQNTSEKLQIIEESAMKIMDTIRRLVKVSSVEYSEYVNGSKMLILPEDETSS
jgi:K+-sensing histidine kinase KdpD